jgi:hypothetical protein
MCFDCASVITIFFSPGSKSDFSRNFIFNVQGMLNVCQPMRLFPNHYTQEVTNYLLIYILDVLLY